MIKIFKSQKGQIITTESVIALALVVAIAISVAFALGENITEVDKGYQSKVKSFFVQGE